MAESGTSSLLHENVSAWLIERGQAERQAPTVWWTGDTQIGWGGWSPDPNLAQRFASKEAAEAVIFAHSRPVGGHVWGRATEHMWVSRG